MRSFARLIKNEFLKVICQTSYKVLLLILLGIFIVTPIFSKMLNFFVYDVVYGGAYGINEVADDYALYAEESSNEVEKQYYLACMKAYKDFAEKGYGFSSWQYDTAFDEYLEYCIVEKMYFLLSTGDFDEEDIGKSEFYYYYDERKADGEITESSNYSVLYNTLKADREDFFESLVSADIADFYRRFLEQTKEDISYLNEYIISCEAQLIYNETEELRLSLEHAKDLKKAEQLLAEAYQYIIDNRVEYGSWQYVTVVSNMQGTVTRISGAQIMTEKEYEKETEHLTVKDSYSEYVDEKTKYRCDLMETAEVLLYSVKNGIPLEACMSVSSKSTFRSAVMSNINVILIFIILLASLIISNEYSSGASRLLFIRPHSRSKILLSKYVTVLLIGAGLVVSSLFVSFLVTISLNGIGDIFKPDLYYSGGRVVKVNALISFLGTVLLSQIRIIFIASLAFMLVALTKKGALGILLGIAANMFMGIAQSVMMLFKPDFLKFTLFPYYYMEIFSSNAAEYYAYASGSMNLLMPSYLQNYETAKDYSIFGGFATYALFIGVILAITFGVFRKQEIKN